MAGLNLLQFSLINDEPVADPGADLLGARGPAEQLAALLVASRGSTPFTLSVDSGWGTGKSSLMRLVEKELREKHGARTVWYNAWSSTGAEAALEGLIKSVLGEFDKSILRRTVYKVSKHSTTLKLIRAVVRLLAGVFGLGQVVNELWRGLRVSPQARNEMRDAIREAVQKRVEDGEFAPKHLLVVFIDDLDRCTEETVLAVCEAVKIYLDIPGLAFVIGCDRSALTSNGLLRDLSPAGSAFMEKIFQTTYPLPAPDAEGIENFIRHCARQSNIEVLLNDGVVSRIAEHSRGNPRWIKKLVNGLVLEVRLNPLWRDFVPQVADGFADAGLATNGFVTDGLATEGAGDGVTEGVDGVVSALVLQHLYPAFYRMLVGRGSAEGDVLAEFQTYRRVWRRLRLRAQGEAEENVADDDEVTGFFNEHVVPPPLFGQPDDWDKDLESLEAELPREFPELIADRGFTSLIDDLRKQPRYEELIQRLRQRPPSGGFTSQLEEQAQPPDFDDAGPYLQPPLQATPQVGPVPYAYGQPYPYPAPYAQQSGPPFGQAYPQSYPQPYGVGQGPPQTHNDPLQYAPPPYASEQSPWGLPAPRAEQPLDGRRILWIDDNPATVQSDVRMMRQAGAHVEVVQNRSDAERELGFGDVDLLISDITRGDDNEAGFTDVLGLRNGDYYSGPVIFFTGRVTPAREARAERLNAGITASPDMLHRLVANALTRDRDRDRDRERERERERERGREPDRERQPEGEREPERDRE